MHIIILLQATLAFPTSAHLQLVTMSHAMEHIHRQHVVIHSNMAILKDGRHLKLGRCHLVVARLDGDTKLVELQLALGDGSAHARRNATKVVVLQLLVEKGKFR